MSRVISHGWTRFRLTTLRYPLHRSRILPGQTFTGIFDSLLKTLIIFVGKEKPLKKIVK